MNRPEFVDAGGYMVLKDSFSITPGLYDMVRQYKRTDDILPGVNGARIKKPLAGKLAKNIKKFEMGELDSLLDEVFVAITDNFKVLIKSALMFNVLDVSFKKELIKNKECFLISLTLDTGETLTVDISLFDKYGSFDSKSLLIEKSEFCWLMDSRSPFYSAEFKNLMEDIYVLSNIQACMTSDIALLSEMTEVIKSIFYGKIQ